MGLLARLFGSRGAGDDSLGSLGSHDDTKRASSPSAASGSDRAEPRPRARRNATGSDLSSNSLKEQLAAKVKGSNRIPASFYDRAIAFKAQEKSRERVVSPRSSGVLSMKQGRFSSWVLVCCAIRKGKLVVDLVPPSMHGWAGDKIVREMEASRGQEHLRVVSLVGAHLESVGGNGSKSRASLDAGRPGHSKESTEFIIKESANCGSTNGSNGGGKSPARQNLYFRCETVLEKQEWFVGFAQVPGVFRRVEDYYSLGPLWGQGATCKVHQCYSVFSGATFALKSRLKTTRESTEAMHNELRILQMAAKDPHPSIPKLVDFFFDTNGTIEIVTELMRGGELFDDIAERPLPEDEARVVFEQVASGLAHLHALGIGHRDIKPENIMYINDPDGGGDDGEGDEAGGGDDGGGKRGGVSPPSSSARARSRSEESLRVKIMDYDLAKINYCVQGWVAGTPCGTSLYMAPEIVREDPEYSLAIDDWSLGVTLYVMLSGRAPFGGKNDDEVGRAILQGDFLMDGGVWDTISWEAKDLIRKLLCTDPSTRLTATSALAHPFVSAGGAREGDRGIDIPIGRGRSQRLSISDIPLKKIEENSMSFSPGEKVLLHAMEKDRGDVLSDVDARFGGLVVDAVVDSDDDV